MMEAYDSESLKIEEPETIEINPIYKSPRELLDVSERVDTLLKDMIDGINAQFAAWNFTGNTDKSILRLMEDVKDICRLGGDEQNDIQAKLKVIMDLLK
jgi:ubiquinone biosynthesis protein COQ9